MTINLDQHKESYPSMYSSNGLVKTTARKSLQIYNKYITYDK